MRRLKNDFDNAPLELIECAKKNQKDLLENHKINANCYKKAGTRLDEQFLGKCAYCETEYFATSDTWIEHYRPKSVYYWLAYEWSNLIPTCTKCNRKKNNSFPIILESKRVKSPPQINGKLDFKKCKADDSSLFNEFPYLVHPKIDEPVLYFDFKLDSKNIGIEIVGIDKEGKKDISGQYSGRGQATIEICDLNRTALKNDRQKQVIDSLIERFDDLISCEKNGEIDLIAFKNLLHMIFKSLISKAENISLEHTLLRKSIIKPEKFNEIVCSYIEDENEKKIIMLAFKQFISKNI